MKTIEISLRKLTFSNDSTLTLSFLAQESKTGTSGSWAVAQSDISHQPIVMFNSYEDALEEMQKRAGISMMMGQVVKRNETWGEIRGKLVEKPIRRDGYRIIRKRDLPEAEPAAVVPKKTLRMPKKDS